MMLPAPAPTQDARNSSAPESAPRPAQRERILDAAIDTIAREGHANATVGKFVDRAGVSRPTFYEYFVDKDACLTGAVAAISEQLQRDIDSSLYRDESGQTTRRTVDALASFCHTRPAHARVLFVASLAGPPATLDARATGIARIAHTIDSQRAHDLTSSAPDIATDVLLGGIYRLFASRLRRDRLPNPATAAAIVIWIESYAPSTNRRGWAALASRHPRSIPRIAAEPPFGRAPLAIGRRSAKRDLDYARQRVLYAVGEIAREKGISAATIADITSRAGIGYRRFRSLFATREDAFLALHELGYRRTYAATAGAFFSHGSWADRVWAAGAAYTEAFIENPTLAHVGFVEPYGAGVRVERQMDHALKVFTGFLYEGYAHIAADRARPPRLSLDAIAMTIFELGYRACRGGDSGALPSLLPQAVYVALTPFLGPDETFAFIEHKLSDAAPGNAT
jgi:AcrR family transcriptional regulator